MVSTPKGTKLPVEPVDVVEKNDTREKLPMPLKATSVIMSDLLIRIELHSNGMDGPQVQTTLSTDNNKGGSVVSHPKPTINLVPKKDVPEGNATISWDSKDYH